MKRILTLLGLMLALATGTWAQNANRSGIFVELGAGAPIGALPASKIKWENNTLYAVHPSGPDVNLALGYRLATSRAVAIELKAEASVIPSAFEPTITLAVMPGIRYTTKEIIGNTSMFFSFNAGVALGYDCYDEHQFNLINLNTPYEKDCVYDYFAKAVGAKINLALGFNFTSSFYAGLCLDYSYLSSQFTNFRLSGRLHGDSKAIWGSTGVKLGIRF